MRLAVLASGAGSNLAHIYREIARGAMPSVELGVVISNNSKSGALQFALEHGIPHAHVSLVKSNGNEDRYIEDFLNALESNGVSMLALAGYLKKLPDVIIERFQNRTLNVHPALLPSFGGASMYGRRVHEAVLARGCKVSGATVHLVTNEYDAGPIVLQQCCDVYDTDTVETLERRVRAIEHIIFPRAIELLAAHKLRIQDNRVTILDQDNIL